MENQSDQRRLLQPWGTQLSEDDAKNVIRYGIMEERKTKWN